MGFSTSSSTSTSLTNALAKANSDALTLSGSNGTLEIHDLHLIVDKAKLGQDAEDQDADGTEVEVEREVVEQPCFLDLPLQGSEGSPVTAGDMPEGTYNELGFEVDDLDDDDGRARELLSDIRSGDGFSNRPKDASMVVVGTFASTGGAPTFFTTYFEAEIGVERELRPPLEVTGEGFSCELTVRLDSAQWFERPNATLMDRSQSDNNTVEESVEFEAEHEFEDGVSEIEFE